MYEMDLREIFMSPLFSYLIRALSILEYRYMPKGKPHKHIVLSLSFFLEKYNKIKPLRIVIPKNVIYPAHKKKYIQNNFVVLKSHYIQNC